jgi:hypothetical protein
MQKIKYKDRIGIFFKLRIITNLEKAKIGIIPRSKRFGSKAEKELKSRLGVLIKSLKAPDNV